MHCLKVLVQKQVILLFVMFCMSDLYICIFEDEILKKLRAGGIGKLEGRYLLEYEPLLYFVCTWHRYKN